ncbi:hypothetical protein [Nonomuraea wenchangensis]|uniref:Uncharacterized protein n=1 Tax=Nonomuraea wenchangensis TaxID=568860 RepID=A0A1I0LTM3_9ACTN|nr:hypothetical protein [Nonomuraea wenchangensis]SEU46518.1 hypothetical protein SAMN05421811_12763 [Nonomuraea wenchangensis]
MSLRTTLSPEKLAELAAEGKAEAARSPFVNPDAVAASKKILRERGEVWAASVLMRDLSRRSLALPQYPWLEDGELETLILADRAEWDQLAAAAQGGEAR